MHLGNLKPNDFRAVDHPPHGVMFVEQVFDIREVDSVFRCLAAPCAYGIVDTLIRPTDPILYSVFLSSDDIERDVH